MAITDGDSGVAVGMGSVGKVQWTSNGYGQCGQSPGDQQWVWSGQCGQSPGDQQWVWAVWAKSRGPPSGVAMGMGSVGKVQGTTQWSSSGYGQCG